VNALDQTSTARPAPAWTGELVRQRLVEAASVERRLPGIGARRLRSTWPATPLHTFTEMMHWDDARERVWNAWENAKGAYPIEVSRMEEAQAWLVWLPEVERRYLDAWAVASARSLSVSAMLGKRHIPRRTFYRVIERAAQRIAERLNKQGVQVR
jgi:hypothetical protein